jgi:hypothetical protein
MSNERIKNFRDLCDRIFEGLDEVRKMLNGLVQSAKGRIK